MSLDSTPLDSEELNKYISNLTNYPEIVDLIQDRLQQANFTAIDIEDIDQIAREVLSECHREADEALLMGMRRGFRSL